MGNIEPEVLILILVLFIVFFPSCYIGIGNLLNNTGRRKSEIEEARRTYLRERENPDYSKLDKKSRSEYLDIFLQIKYPRIIGSRRYINHCWRCKSKIDSERNIRCSFCGWYICKCGACKDTCSGGLELYKRAEKAHKNILKLDSCDKEYMEFYKKREAHIRKYIDSLHGTEKEEQIEKFNSEKEIQQKEILMKENQKRYLEYLNGGMENKEERIESWGRPLKIENSGLIQKIPEGKKEEHAEILKPLFDKIHVGSKLIHLSFGRMTVTKVEMAYIYAIDGSGVERQLIRNETLLTFLIEIKNT